MTAKHSRWLYRITTALEAVTVAAVVAAIVASVVLT